LHSHRRELLVGDLELRSRIESAAVAPQPLAEQQVRAGELGAHAGSAEVVDRRAKPAFGVGAAT
jgi:hypothetical protein